MVICFFSTQYLPTPGGVERYTWNLARRCVAAGHRALVVTASLPGLPARERDADGIEIYRLPSWPVMGGRFPVLKPFADADDLWAQGIDFAVIQTRMYTQSVWAARQCKRRGIPALVIDHSTGYMLHGGLAGALGKAYEHAACGSIRRCGFPFYGVSGDVCRWLETFGIQAAGRLPNAVDPAELERLAHADNAVDWRRRLNVPAGGRLVAFVGRLIPEKGALRLDLRRLAFHAGTLKQILLIGLPAGLQSTVFSLSNVVIQSSINSFGSMVVAGNSASSNLEGFVYTAMNAFAQAAVTFTSQNIGARKYHNLDRVIRNCLLCVVVTGLVLGGGAALAGHQLLRFYSSDTAVIATGAERLRLICGFYLLCGIMDVLASSLRGLGYSVLPMVVSLVGVCVLRLVWIATIFQLNRTPFMLYISYPISWALTALVHLACLLVVRRKLRQKQPQTI